MRFIFKNGRIIPIREKGEKIKETRTSGMKATAGGMALAGVGLVNFGSNIFNNKSRLRIGSSLATVVGGASLAMYGGYKQESAHEDNLKGKFKSAGKSLAYAYSGYAAGLVGSIMLKRSLFKNREALKTGARNFGASLRGLRSGVFSKKTMVKKNNMIDFK
jgi:ammonia channel protein AmtB